MKSVFWQDARKNEFPSQNEDLKTDVLIIGGGIAGILTAYMLERGGAKCVLCEKGEICCGETGGTTAKITVQHGLIYSKLIGKYGADFARGYLESQLWALEEYKSLSKRVDCELEEKSSFVYSLSDRGKIEREIAALDKIGFRAELCEPAELPFSVAGAAKTEGQAQFNPIKLLFSLAKELTVFEKTEILSLDGDIALTNRGKIKAKKIIIATHFPFPRWKGAYFMKMYQHRSYVIALEGAAEINGMYVDENQNGLSFRNYKSTLLLGGGGHRTGKIGGGWEELRSFAKRYYPSAKEVAHFAAQDCMTLDDVPYIGRLSEKNPDVLVTTGFGKWGMTSAMLSAKILSDSIFGEKNDYSELFSPKRSIWHPRLISNAAHSVVGLLRPTVPRCSHLGCALKYNKQEHSWDCSCHGSRYNEYGKVLDAPAARDINIRKRNE